MKLHEPSGLWFPDNESRPQKMYDGLQKYINDANFMLSLLPKKAKKRLCVQAGGHIGVWPLKLAPYFSAVVTFEPDPLAFKALQRNVAGKNILTVEAALGEATGEAEFSWYSGRTAVGTMVEVKDEGDQHSIVTVCSVDQFMYADVAAIVLDIEGYEPWALRGARQTIERCRPLILCEMLKKSAPLITSTLAEMGYQPIDNPVNRKCRDMVFAYGGQP